MGFTGSGDGPAYTTRRNLYNPSIHGAWDGLHFAAVRKECMTIASAGRFFGFG